MGSLCTCAAVHAQGDDLIMPWHAWQSMRPYIISIRNPAVNLSCQVLLLVAVLYSYVSCNSAQELPRAFEWRMGRRALVLPRPVATE
jgi:hypothetical protein